MLRELQVPLFDLVMCLSNAVDLVSPAVVNHHKRVAYIASSIGEELGLPAGEKNDLLLAGMLHDIGALSLRERIETLQFEVEDPHKHAELGFLLLKMFKPFSAGVATLVRFHHVPWEKGEGSEFQGKQVPLGSHILHLADRVAVLVNNQQEILGQVKEICEVIEGRSGKMFVPELVNAFRSLATREYFWLDIVSQSVDLILYQGARLTTVKLDLESLLSLAKLFAQVIDFRSPFTATHSSGVATSAESLAEFLDFSERECRMMRIAGYLHDLGKLAVPPEILEKPAKLTPEEFNVIRSHTFYTCRTLERIDGLELVNAWAAFHHERLDGTGYPFHLKGEDLSLGSRIMAVADVFTAVTEDRPYRKGMTADRTLRILQGMAEDGALDPHVVSVLCEQFEEVNSARIAAQEAASASYLELRGDEGR